MRTRTRAAALITTLLAIGGLAALPASAATTDGHGHGGDARCARELTAANEAFDAAFFARDVNRFIDFYADDATIIYFNGTHPYTKEEARANSTALFKLDFTASFDVLKTTVQGCDSGQVIEDAHFSLDGVTSHFLVGLSWAREHGRWRVQIDQGTALLRQAGARASATTLSRDPKRACRASVPIAVSTMTAISTGMIVTVSANG
jgi:ketosteroid isomerase-like protein